MTNMIHVGLIDDHPVVREGLRVFLNTADDLEVTLEAASGEDALTALKTVPCDVILLDLALQGALNGLSAFRAIRSQWPHIRAIILTSFPDRDNLHRMRDEGVSGYLNKTVHPDDLLAAIRQVAKGRIIWEGLQAIEPALIEPLTPREEEVLAKLAEGFSNKEIAHRLKIREKTVKVHISHILAKLGVLDRTQAVITAHRLGLIHLPDSKPF